MKSTKKKKKKQAHFRLSKESPTIKLTEGSRLLSAFGGLTILSKIDNVFNLAKSAAKNLVDKRKESKVDFQTESLLKQCILLATMGLPDTNDADKFRYDPAFLAALEKPIDGSKGGLASQPTISRFLDKREPEELDALDNWFVDFYLRYHKKCPKQICIYLDGTKVETYGHQEGAMYRGGKYKSNMYFPLTATTDDGQILGGKVRQGDKAEAKTVLSMLIPIVEKLRRRWPEVEILIIVDGAFKSSDLFNWCENNNVDYIAGFPNSHAMQIKVKGKAARLENKFRKEHSNPKFVLPDGTKDKKKWTKEEKRIQNITDSKERMEEVKASQARRVRSFHQSDHHASSWPNTDPERCMVSRLDYSDDGLDVRHVVTNLEGFTPEEIYEKYCTRGTSEQWIGEIKDLSQLKLNSQSFNANRFRFLIDCMAYMLVFLLRESCSHSYQHFTLKNLRSLLIEVAAVFTRAPRHLRTELTANFEHVNELLRVARKLEALKI